MPLGKRVLRVLGVHRRDDVREQWPGKGFPQPRRRRRPAERHNRHAHDPGRDQMVARWAGRRNQGGEETEIVVAGGDAQFCRC